MLKGHPKPYYEDFFGLGFVNTPREAFLLCGLIATVMFQSQVSWWWIPAFIVNMYVLVPEIRNFLDAKVFDRFQP